jgi:hypothetical protein
MSRWTKHYIQGLFNHETLTVQFGGKHSKPENIFTATAIKIPDYKYKLYERAGAGGGCYYDYKEWNEYEETNAYLIFRDGVLIGWMKPHHDSHGIKSMLFPMEEKKTHIQIKQFAEKYKAHTHES